MATLRLQTIKVPHLGGITAAYRATEIDPALPTLVLINSFTTSSELYTDQFSSSRLVGVINLIAIDVLGHGDTRGPEEFTYWDTATMNIQVLEALGIKKAFLLGTSQGGWIVARMALQARDLVQGIIPCGTSMDFESQRSRDLGCWDCDAVTADTIKGLTTPGNVNTPDFGLPDALVGPTITLGFGQNVDAAIKDKWVGIIQRNYAGDEGRRRLRMCTINLASRDGLHLRLPDIHCPVLWLHGTNDIVYSVANAQDEIKLFTNAPEATVQVIEGGHHFLSATNPKEVEEAVVNFITKHA